MIAEDEYQDKSDEEIVEMTLEHHRHLQVLIDRYSEKLIRYIHRSTRVSQEEAEDILQESFIKAYYNLNSFDPSLSFSSWIYRIVHNQVVSQHRKKSVRPQGNAIDVDQEVVEQMADDFEVLDDIDRGYLRDHLTEILDQMDLKYREVLVLKYFQGKSYEEISDIVKKPPGTIATLLNRAKKHAHKLIEEQGHYGQ